jgi:hypothetical protein
MLEFLVVAAALVGLVPALRAQWHENRAGFIKALDVRPLLLASASRPSRSLR